MRLSRWIYLAGVLYVGLIVGLAAYWWHPEIHPRLSLGIAPAVPATASPAPSRLPADATATPQTLGASAVSTPPTSSALAGPTPIWADEFTGPAGSLPDPTRWNINTGGDGWGNGEWEYYTASPSNVALDGAGHLVITARRPVTPPGSCATGPCNITSARLTTAGKFAPTYGHVEARIKTPAGLGFWPAFWLYAADDNGEIDIMENNGRDPYIVSSTAHVPGYTPPEGLSAELGLTPGSSAAQTFHLYAVDWTPTSIVWSVDGRTYHTVKQGGTGGAPWVFNHPFYIILNLAVGSDDPGYPNADTPFPAQLVVDYVRAYK